MTQRVIAWELPEAFVFERAVETGDVDRLGHANNAVYLRWCEEAGWAHTEAVGCGFADWQRLGRAMVTYRATLEYRAPCHTGERIAIGVWLVANDGRLRATRRFQIVREDDGRTLFRAEILYACVDLASGRPRRMPPEFRKAYAVRAAVAAALGG